MYKASILIVEDNKILISDALVMTMVDEWLTQPMKSQTVIFDGFPRTVPQAETLQELLESRGDMALHLVRLVIPDEDLVYRLLARSICQNNSCQMVYSLHKGSGNTPTQINVCNECSSPLVRRSDDEEAAIMERLRIYHEHEMGLHDFYEKSGHPVSVLEAHMPLEDVYERLLETTGFTRS